MRKDMQKMMWSCVSLVLVAIITVFLGFENIVCAATQYETEVNDTYSTANVVVPGDTVIGNINSRSDVDYYKITAPSNGKIGVSFCHIYEDSSEDWDINIYKYINGEYIELSYLSVNLNENEKIDLPYIGAVNGEIYYIKVSRCCSGVVGKNYTIKTSFAKSEYYEKEMNNVYSAATVMAINKSYSGTLNNSSDEDIYKIVAPKNGKLSISFNHTYADSSDDWDVYIYRYSNGEYSELSYYSINLNENEKIELPYIGTVKNGIYYVKVKKCCNGVVGKNYTISTTFKSSNYFEKEKNDVYSTATLISPNHSYSGVLNSSIDSDYYKIVAPAKGTLKVSFKHTFIDSYDDWDVYVYLYANGEYKELSYVNVDLNSNGTVSLPTIGTSKNGIYYIKVSKCCNGVVGKNYIINTKFNFYSLTKLKAKTTKKSAKITWGKVKGAAGYQVQMKKGRKYKKLTTVKKTKYTFKKLLSKKKYTFRVRYYKTINGKKFYSAWKQITIKTK